MGYPKLTGSIKITEEQGTIVIAGDPDGLRSFSRLIGWLADADLEAWPYLPAGGQAHIHVYPRIDISADSRNVELLRLDVKGGCAPSEGRSRT